MGPSSSTYRDLLADRRLAYFWGSTAAGEAGYSIYVISILWLTFRSTGSDLITGAVILVEFGFYGLGFLVGPFIDRAPNLRGIRVAGYAVQVLEGGALAITYFLGVLNVPILLSLVALGSFLWNFAYTANNAVVPRLLPSEALFRANGLSNTVIGLSNFFGYVAGGASVVFLGPGGGMIVYAGLLGVGAILSIPVSATARPAPKTSYWEEFQSGWRYLRSDRGRPLLSLALFSVPASFLQAAPPLLITFLAGQQPGNPAFSYAALFTGFTVGSVAGGLVLGRLNPRKRLAFTLAIGTITEGAILLLAMALAPDLAAGGAAWFGVGFADVVFWTVYLASVQGSVPTTLVGRVNTNTYLFQCAARGAGGLVAGGVAGVIGPVSLGLAVGAALVGLGAVASILPGLRKLRF